MSDSVGAAPSPAPSTGTRAEVVVSIDVNGSNLSVRTDTRTRLLDVLRDDAALSSVRDGCSVGMCGACTVLLDGTAVSSCLILAVLCDGAHVRTAESLESGGVLDPVAQAFVEERAFQCGYCTPGFVMALRGLLDAEPTPTREQLETWLSGHICRCGSYARILDAAARAAGVASAGVASAGESGGGTSARVAGPAAQGACGR